MVFHPLCCLYLSYIFPVSFSRLVQTGNQAVTSLVRPLIGPQSIELELSMELYSGEQFGGIAVAKLFIYVSEYEF